MQLSDLMKGKKNGNPLEMPKIPPVPPFEMGSIRDIVKGHYPETKDPEKALSYVRKSCPVFEKNLGADVVRAAVLQAIEEAEQERPGERDGDLSTDRIESELAAWCTIYPNVRELLDLSPMNYFEGEQAYFKLVITQLAILKNTIPEEERIEWAFDVAEIGEIMDRYAGGGWITEKRPELRERQEKMISETVQAARAKYDNERKYLNNLPKPWKQYLAPSADKGGYILTDAGIKRQRKEENENGEEYYTSYDVCRTPFVVCGISEPSDREGVYYKIRHGTYSGEVREFWASQSELLSRKDLKTVFLKNGINCPETSLLMETVEYISRSIAEFGPELKKEASATRNGWNEELNRFVVGERCITPDGIEPVLAVSENSGVFGNLTKKGSLPAWKDAVRDLLEYDLIRFKCYDALTAPLKAILSAESHVTDHWGDSSCGKTFSAWLALSMIGDAEKLMIGAKSTKKGILIHVRDFSDLPVLIDETSDAGGDIADLVYTLTSNKGRVKSTVNGTLDGGEHYRTTAMLTGEKPVRDVLTNSGQQYRVNELAETLPNLPAEKINEVRRAIGQNHGHVIEPYIEQIYREQGRIEEIYKKCLDKLPDPRTNIEGRSKSIFALIMTAGVILEKVFRRIGIAGKDPEEIVKTFYSSCVLDQPVELEYIRALRVVLDWVAIEHGRFSDGTEDGDRTKRYGWTDGNYIDIIGKAFVDEMEKEGFSPTKIKQSWHQNGITVSNDTKRKGTARFTRDGKTRSGVRIIRPIAEELAGAVTDQHQFKPDDRDQYEKIKKIMKTVRALTDIRGKAETRLIQEITEIPELEEYLKMLAENGRVFQLDQTTFKAV